MALFAPALSLLANAGPRIDMSQGGRGGYITRVFYCEPYLAYPWVRLFLEGTVVPVAGPGAYARVHPHNDPIYDWYYCSDVQVHPFSPETVTGQALTRYAQTNDQGYNEAGTGGVQTAVNNVLNAVDDHGYTNIVDFGPNPAPTPAQIAAGGIPNPFPSQSETAYRGKCGAYIVATYTPLIFLDGLPEFYQGGGAVDPFDYVIGPDWMVPIEVSTQTGRNLFFYGPQVVITGNNLYLNQGLLDTFSVAEVLWEFSITRKMVPFLPSLTIGAFNNKLNAVNSHLGNLSIPLRTARFMCPENPPLMKASDGATFYNITYKYRLRKLFHEYFRGNTATDYVPGGWIDWNHHFGIPASRVWPNEGVAKPSYYPVVWNGGLFQLFGTNTPLYLDDSMLGSPDPLGLGPGNYALFSTEFEVGFKPGQ